MCVHEAETTVFMIWGIKCCKRLQEFVWKLWANQKPEQMINVSVFNQQLLSLVLMSCTVPVNLLGF